MIKVIISSCLCIAFALMIFWGLQNEENKVEKIILAEEKVEKFINDTIIGIDLGSTYSR